MPTCRPSPRRSGWTRRSPRVWGNVVTPDMYYRHRQDIEAAMGRVPALAAEADRDWAERTGRS